MAGLAGWPVVVDDIGTKRDGTRFNKALTDAILASIDGETKSTTPANENVKTRDIIDEIIDARGTEASLSDRLDVALNPDGTLKSSSTDVPGVAGENLTTGDCVYLADGTGGTTAGRWYKTDADAVATSTIPPIIGFATELISTAATGVIRKNGRIAGFVGLTAGAPYYISPSPGLITTVAPANARFVAVADSTTSIVLNVREPLATTTLAGLLSEVAQSIAGAKTFTGALVASSTLAVTGSATLTSGVTFPSTNTLSNLIYARSAANITRNNSTVFQDVTGLSFAVGANQTWVFLFMLHATSSAVADFKFTLTGPAAPTGIRYGTKTTVSGDSSSASAFGSDVRVPAGGGSQEGILIHGLLRNGANAGTVQIQMSQLAAEVSDTIVYADSAVLALRLA